MGYSPPVGPAVNIYLTYNQREDSQPANFDYTNIGQKWTLNWVDFIVDDPGNPGASVLRNLSGGGSVPITSYNPATGRFAPNPYDGSVLVLASVSPIVYRRLKADGSVDVYAESNGATAYPRRIFLSQVIDPQGNAVTLSYDAQGRLAALVDAGGRQTIFAYDSPGRSLLVSRITDPYGRSANLVYDDLGRLISISDTIGLVSTLAYDANWLVSSFTTPYGTTSFAYTAPGGSGPPRFAEIADPMGFRERVEWVEPAPVPVADPAGTVPQGMPIAPVNNYLDYRNSFYWDKSAYAVAGCTPSGGCNYSMARATHFLHATTSSTKSTTPESIKLPYENRVWYAYPGQTSPIVTGAFAQPSAVGRVLDDGSTQLTRFAYDTGNFYKPTQIVDPLGRTTSVLYANGIDPTAIVQTGAAGWPQVLAQWTWDYRHRPASYTDAAGQTTLYTWNAAGQPLSVTNALGQTTSWQYDGSGRLSTITNANDAVVATFTYDAFDRVASFTESEGWSVAYAYDVADRLVRTTYPDGTNETYTYDRLDLVSFRDRLRRVWSYAYDANRRRITVTDPAGLQTQFGYDRAGRLTALTDPRGNITRWRYDVQGRPVAKIYPDGRGLTYVYEATTSRLKAVVDALGQRKEYSYAEDDQVTGIAYVNTVNPTPGVTFAYDPILPRMVSMTDGTGTTTYSYVPLGMPGALKLQQETLPLASASIAYTYDALGRVTGRTVAGSGAEAFAYDAIGRLTGKTNDLGTFTLSYLGETGQIVQRALTGSTLATTWTYLNNVGDRRLAGIGNVGLTASEYSNFAFTTLVDGSIASVTETSDAAPVYPVEARQVTTYNNLNQLQVAVGPVRTYDANGNLLSDGQRVYAWDAENRLVGITYPAAAGKQTAFGYDGQGRRIAISETPAGGGSAVTTSYVWCDDSPCQSRDAGNAVERSYLEEGERIPGVSPQNLYYGSDQIGSVRRVFASGGAAPSYAYDPYGLPLQATPQLTEFGYAGMRTHAASGLYTTWFRFYDPTAGLWVSRDPVGEASDIAGNLYAYVGGDPIGRIDPNGDLAPLLAAAAVFAAAFLTSSPANAPKPCDPVFPRDDAAPFVNAAMAAAGMAGVGSLGKVPVQSLGTNPFKGKTAKEAAEMLERRGYVPRGPDPAAGRGTYVNPQTGRGYHIDGTHLPPKGPHVGVHRPRDLRGTMPPRDYPLE